MLYLILIFSLFSLVCSKITFHNATVIGHVSVDRNSSEVCKPLEMEIVFELNARLYDDQSIYFYLSGFTNGPCTYPGNGRDQYIEFISNTTGLELYWYEGTYQNMYQDSVLRVYIREAGGIAPNEEITIRIDRSNKFKFQCMQDTAFAVEVRKLKSQSYYEAIGQLTFDSFIPQYCFPFLSNLSFYPANEQQYMEINITLRFPMDFKVGDNITVLLPGFTRTAFQTFTYDGDLTGINWDRANADGSLTLMTYINGGYGYARDKGYINWHAEWYEGGGYSPGEEIDNMYNESKIVIWIKRDSNDAYNNFIPGAAPFSIIIDRSNKLSTYCGQRNDFPGFKFRVDSDNSSLIIPFMSINHTQAIGGGCPFGLNIDKKRTMCSSNGVCNYCNQQCECFDGHGSANDKVKLGGAHNFASDCSGSICPFGISFGRFPNKWSPYGIHAGVHATAECSDRGICNRENGLCKCFEGYEGNACQRKACPGSPACSGRGKCVDMERLVMERNGLPFRTQTVEKEYMWYVGKEDSLTWDGNALHACVCDSAWSIGFGENETQLGEYFGPSCEFRRCPSGDDPTTQADETDCFNKNLVSNSADRGAAGNLCYVECSNRGRCDYTSGLCTCLPGVYGDNCGNLFEKFDYVNSQKKH